MDSDYNNQFAKVIERGLDAGIHIVAPKNHGKTRLLFNMARKLREKARVLIFDGSEAWLYGFDKIPTFTINENDIVLTEDVKTTEDIEKYALVNWQLIEYALRNYKDILFRLKTRKPSKRGFFIRTVINYLDTIQRNSREFTINNEAKGYITYFIEESQDAFNSRSTTRLEAEEFLTVFNEARNQKEFFYTASQRLTDFSKTIRTKQVYCIGAIAEEDISMGMKRLEKNHNVNLAKMPSRTWFFDGFLFKSPEWKQNGKPYQIEKTIEKLWIESLHPIKPEKQKGIFRQFLEGVGHTIMSILSFPKIHKPLGQLTQDQKEQIERDEQDNQEEDELQEEFDEDLN